MPHDHDDDHHDHDHDHAHDHDHDHGHPHSHSLAHHHHMHSPSSPGAPRALIRAMAVTFLFMAIEAAGGWFSNSLALYSDAAHMLTDVGAMLLSLFAIWMARRPTTQQMSFGYHRAEILGALASGLIIWLISGILVFEAITRFQSPPEVNGPIVLVVAAIGLAANLFSMRMLHSTKDESMNVRAAYLHMLSDALGSIGAVVAGAVLWLTGWRLIDPIITIVFAALMLYSSWALVKEAVGILMESTPLSVNAARVQADLAAIPGVQEVHDLHIWAVTNRKSALSVHLIATDSQTLLETANQILKERHQIHHTTIQIEHPDRFNSERCYDCGPAKQA